MSSLADLLTSNPHLRLLPNNRIICEVTGHEMLPNLAVVQSHVNGKKYKRAVEWYRHDFSVYEPLITQHKSKMHKLFCTLTQEELNKIPDQVRKHAEGKRFQRLKQQVALMEKKSKPVVKQAKDKVPDENPDFWIPEEEEMLVQDSESDSQDDEDEDEEDQPIQNNGRKRKLIQAEATEDDKEDELVIVRKKGKGKKARRILLTY